MTGVLDPPTNFAMKEVCSKGQTFLKCCWSSPFTLDGLDIDFFLVTFENKTLNVNDTCTSIPIPASKYASCHPLEVCVAAVTPAGQSNSTCSSIKLDGGLPRTQLSCVY